ncbi:CRAL/TRIO domain containing protein [Lotmaria passim]
MALNYSSLPELGAAALAHRSEIEEVKRQVDIKHGYFDAWIYGFLENKKFNIEETVAKLHRRFAMEANELATLTITDYVRDSLRSGSHQFIGIDKLGRCVFVITLKRDFPDPLHNEERFALFDLFMSYGSRLCKDGKRCQMVAIFNHEGANTKKNFDLTGLLACAKHLAKFYPGALDKTYFCNMGRTLTALAKSTLKAFPAFVTDRLEILSDADLKRGALLKVMDAEVLPVALGGRNSCDQPEGWRAYAEDVVAYFEGVQHAICERGMRVKDYELECLGVAVEGSNSACSSPQPRSSPSLPLSSNNADSGVPQESASEAAIVASSFTAEPDWNDPQSTVVAAPLPSMCLTTQRVTLYQGSAGTFPHCKLQEWSISKSASEDAEDLQCSPSSWFNAVAPLSSALALWFLEELLYWREAIEAAEREDRRRLFEAFATAVTAPRGTHAVAHRKWFSSSMQGATPLLVLTALLLNAVAVVLTS